MKNLTKRLPGAVMAAGALLAVSAADVRAQALEKLTIVIFTPPSLGALLPPVIKNQKFDEKNGLDITFAERPPDAYAAQFNSGEFKIGGSASLTTLGLADVRGVKVKYLFNIFDFWGTVVTSRDSVKSLKDLEGKELAGARSTTNYQMYDFFARRAGVDVSKIKVVNTAPPGLISYAIADRADAVQIWEPAYTLMMTKKPSIRTLDLNIAKTWKDFCRRQRHPVSRRRRAQPTGSMQIRPRCRSSTRLTSRRPNGSEAIRTRPRRCSPRARRRMSSRRLRP